MPPASNSRASSALFFNASFLGAWNQHHAWNVFWPGFELLLQCGDGHGAVPRPIIPEVLLGA